MDIIDMIKNSLDENKKLTKEIKTNIFELTILFHNRYPEINLNNLVNHLKTLELKKSSKFINKKVSKYNFRDNILEFNIDEINKGYDMKHVLMSELLEIITNNGNQTGFNQDDKFRALQAGYREILTNNLIGNDSDLEHLENEIISTNLLAAIVGNDPFFESYFKNDVRILLNSFIEKGVEI